MPTSGWGSRHCRSFLPGTLTVGSTGTIADEDFAETVAVWLNPQSLWRERYAGWPALKKLEYMDRLMGSLVDARPLVTTKHQVDSLPRLRRTLRKHYERKHAHSGHHRVAL